MPSDNKKKNSVEYYPSALTIAGSDSGGGAGIEADLRTFNALGVYGCAAITAVTAQNPETITRIDLLPAAAVTAQIEAAAAKIAIRCVKTGMLGSAENAAAAAAAVKKHNFKLICDPVMVSTSGARLLEESAVAAMKNLLLKQADWITPNIPEAELLCKRKLNNADDTIQAALQLFEQYQCNVLLKSGHAITGSTVTDTVCYQGKIFALSSPKAEISGNTAHGTGCTLSAAITANLAHGKSWQESLTAAKAFVYGALCEKRNVSSTLQQMYPAESNYVNKITLKEV